MKFSWRKRKLHDTGTNYVGSPAQSVAIQMKTPRTTPPLKWGEVQVSREHYAHASYLSAPRFRALREQLALCMEHEPSSSMLEVGPGPGMLATLLRHFGYSVTTVDFAADLQPDVVASLPHLPFGPQSFDVACAFEVLEHAPLNLLETNLRELKRISRKRVIISLPDQREVNQQSLKVRLTVGNREFSKVLWRQRFNRLTNPNEHYWEIGHDGVTSTTVIEAGRSAGLVVDRSYFCEPWFHFFVFDPRH